MRVFSYKLVRDYGFAPNPFGEYCTLATCKPQIRAAAHAGDLVIGCGSAALGLQERIIFAMQVAEKISFQEYWNDGRFATKRPNFAASRSHAYGDNIYHREKDVWVQEDSHHSLDDGGLNVSNLTRDTGADAVLVATNFIYWGNSAVPIPLELQDGTCGDQLYPPARSHRSVFSPEFVEHVALWFGSVAPRGLQGRPHSWQ